jgi:hypothetical protein
MSVPASLATRLLVLPARLHLPVPVLHDNHMSDERDTIGTVVLIEALYDSNRCSILQAHNIINDVTRSGELKIVATDTYRKGT